MKMDLKVAWLLAFATDANRKNEPAFVKECYYILQLEFLFYFIFLHSVTS